MMRPVFGASYKNTPQKAIFLHAGRNLFLIYNPSKEKRHGRKDGHDV
jgi:hypothetical protein